MRSEDKLQADMFSLFVAGIPRAKGLSAADDSKDGGSGLAADVTLI
jgi:hypothetical protein